MSIQKRGNRWRARYRGPDGRERNKTFTRKVDAQRWLAEQKARMARGSGSTRPHSELSSALWLASGSTPRCI